MKTPSLVLTVITLGACLSARSFAADRLRPNRSAPAPGSVARAAGGLAPAPRGIRLTPTSKRTSLLPDGNPLTPGRSALPGHTSLYRVGRPSTSGSVSSLPSHSPLPGPRRSPGFAPAQTSNWLSRPATTGGRVHSAALGGPATASKHNTATLSGSSFRPRP